MKADTSRRTRLILYPVAALVLAIVVLQVLTATRLISPMVLPTPLSVFEAAGRFGRLILPQIWTTLSTSLIGFGMAAVIGLLAAAIISEFKIINLMVMPILLVIQSLPKVALAPLFVLWLGFGVASRIGISFLTALFPIIVSTAMGLSRVPHELDELSQSLRASRLKAFFKIRLPLAVPSYISGLRIAAPLSVVGAVVGEFVSGANGLGYVVKSATLQGALPLAFVGILILTLMGYLMYVAVMVAGRFAAPWAVNRGR